MYIFLIIVIIFGLAVYFGHKQMKKEEAEKMASEAREAEIRRKYRAGEIFRDDANIAIAQEWGMTVVDTRRRANRSDDDTDDSN